MFFRDASGRLCFEIHDADSMEYESVVNRLVRRLHLKPLGELVVGFDEMFRDYSDGQHTIGLEWDCWSGFLVVARTPDAEVLVVESAKQLRKIRRFR